MPDDLKERVLRTVCTRKQRERQQALWIATNDVVETPGNAFYNRLNQILDEHKFDQKGEAVCRKFYKKSPYGRPSIAPGGWSARLGRSGFYCIADRLSVGGFSHEALSV